MSGTGRASHIPKKKNSLPHAYMWTDQGSNHIIVPPHWGMNEWAMNGKVDENRNFAISFTLEPTCYKPLTRPPKIISH